MIRFKITHTPTGDCFTIKGETIEECKKAIYLKTIARGWGNHNCSSEWIEGRNNESNTEANTMNEIKFRAKRTDNNELVSGFFYKGNRDDVKNVPLGSVRIFWNIITPEGKIFEVMPDSVERYTGCNDEMGKEIYTGDVVTYEGGVTQGIIKFGEYKRNPFMKADKPQAHLGFYIEGIPLKTKAGIINNECYSLLNTNYITIVETKEE